MAPLSLVPGRARFETPLIVGKKEICWHFEERIMALDGVSAASANHRTGRILVKYDENVLSRENIALQIEKNLAATLSGAKADPAKSTCRQPEKKEKVALPYHLLMDMVVHAILPKPFDLLVPTAISVMRK